MEINASFGDWIRRRRKTLDLTQETLAEQVGCSVGLIRKIEGDERRPSRQIAELLANVLHIPANEREKFIQVARAQLRTERLASITSLQDALPEVNAPNTREPAPVPALSYNPDPIAPIQSFNLPIPPTPLIGRESELATLQNLLANPECRLLTLVGPGGMGKTRLALATAASQQVIFAHGTIFVALAALSSPEFMLPAIANALGFSFAGSSDPKRQLLNYLREKHLLLVLDNIEHLLDGVGLLSELLAESATLKLLVTSRERLNLQSEWVFDLQGLPVPTVSQVEQLEAYSAVALFADNARRVHPGFTLDEQNQAAVVRICRLVEGMPLGIELASAWTHMLSCQEIAEEIERNIDFLTAARRDVPERHRSLRATFAYSWQRLSVEEQRVMRQLSVFRGGFLRSAAVQVARASLALLSGLMAKSLIRRNQAGRYEMHELVRQYAASQLSEDEAEEQAAHNRHATWYLALLQEREADLQSKRQQTVRDELTREIDNLRLAWAWGSEQGQFALLRKATPAFWYLYALLGSVHEADALFRQTIARVQAHPVNDAQRRALQQVALGDLLSRGSWFRQSVGHPAEGRVMLEQSVKLLRQYNDQAALAHALLLLATMDLFQGSLTEAKKNVEECLSLSRELGQWWHVGICYGGLGLHAHAQGAYAEALAWYDEALKVLRSVGDPRYIAFTLSNLSRTTLALSQFANTKQILEECRQLAYHIDDRFMMAHVQENLGRVAYVTDDLSEAYQRFSESLLHYRALVDRWGVGRALNQLGQVSAKLGQENNAYHQYRDALQLATETENLPNALNALAGLASLPVMGGAPEHRVSIVLLVLAHPASNQETKELVKHLHDELTAQLTAQQIASAQAKTFEHLVAEILR